MSYDTPEPMSPTDWPVFGLQSDMRPHLAAMLDRGQSGALVTLYAAEGPAPHGVGAQMLIGDDFIHGFLSGGCIEGDIAIHAAEVLASGEPRRLIYGRGGPPDIRLLCGARIELLVERVGPDDAAARRLVALWRTRRPALWLSDGSVRACLEEGEESASLPARLKGAFARAVSTPVVSAPAEDDDVVFRRFDPAPRVVVAGHDPTALAIATLAMQMGWSAVIVRPKGPEAPPPLPGVAYLRGDPREALESLRLDPWTAVAATSHDIESDGDILAVALPSQAAYVGVLGSRRRIPERIAGLRALGVGEEQVARLKAPLGLPIAAQTPWEIAVSVLAEMIETFKAAQKVRTWTPAPHESVPA